MTQTIYDLYIGHRVFLVIKNRTQNIDIVYQGIVKGVNETHLILEDRFVGLVTVPILDIIRIENRGDRQ